MEPGTNLSHKSERTVRAQATLAHKNEAVVSAQGVRTRVLLILAMSFITMGTTLVSLLAVRKPLQNLVVQNISADLLHSLATFEDMEAQRIAALDRENALLADLPSLKALMTTSDERTIADGGAEFWKVSGNDLFALADRDGNVKAAYLANANADATFRDDVRRFLSIRSARFLVSSKGLYGCSIQPLYFGSQTEGALLGYVISGFEIDRKAVKILSTANNVQAAFRSEDRTLASSIVSADVPWKEVTKAPFSQTFTLTVGSEQLLAVTHDLSKQATGPLILVELKSLEAEEQAIREINRLLLLAGILALLLGAALMLALSRVVTRPLEMLATGVHAFGSGDSTHILPYRGTREVQELSRAFARMRREILQANQALIEAERLATIGRMASSVSHDLRHYLSAIYANSEFLASDKLPLSERNEILAEIRTAVNGTTEMLESLLIFSRTGKYLTRTQQSMSVLAERAVSLMRSHPDAAGVRLSFQADEASATEAFVDTKQVERAIYNLLLNACQAPRATGATPEVSVQVAARGAEVVVEVSDNGEGVPQNIRSTLFEPFVSEGKHKGSGIGLTLTQAVASEHGGNVALVSSETGKTVFRFTIARARNDSNNQLAYRVQAG
jgi:signal transduction histidine kinase